jgi:hypothetical protein
VWIRIVFNYHKCWEYHIVVGSSGNHENCFKYCGHIVCFVACMVIVVDMVVEEFCPRWHFRFPEASSTRYALSDLQSESRCIRLLFQRTSFKYLICSNVNCGDCNSIGLQENRRNLNGRLIRNSVFSSVSKCVKRPIYEMVFVLVENGFIRITQSVELAMRK